jgi:predicted MFS family arabinose efflux permease
MSGEWRLFAKVTLPLAALNLINQASRTVMAVIGPTLALEFALSARELGLLAACMFAVYALAQLPDGLALDRIGPRRLQAALSVVTAAGFAMFALADGFLGFAAARIVLGIGISAGLMALIKANTDWFAPASVARMSAIGTAIGVLGSMVATVPAQAALPLIGWRGVLWLLCAASLAVALWIFFAVPERRAGPSRPALGDEVRVLLSVCTSPTFWRHAPAVAMLSALNFTYLGLWAGPWLRDVAGYDGSARAATLLLYTFGMLAGVLITGALTSRAQARGYPAKRILLASSAGLLAAQIILALGPSGAAVPAVWVLFAFCTAGATPGYVLVGQMFPREQTGRVTTAANGLTLAAAFVLQVVIGAVLDLWPRTPGGGWDPHGYSAALWLSAVVHAFIAAQLLRRRS